MATSDRREREKQQRRNLILDVAREFFYENGYQGTTIDMIGERAELSKGAIYQCFGSKNELYIAVCIDGIEVVGQQLVEVSGQDLDPEDKIRAVFFCFVDFCMENRALFRIIQDFLNEFVRANLSDELIQTINQLNSKIMSSMVCVVQEGIDGGLLRKDLDPSHLITIIWRMATGLVELGILGDSSGIGHGEFRGILEEGIDFLIEGAKERDAGRGTG